MQRDFVNAEVDAGDQKASSGTRNSAALTMSSGCPEPVNVDEQTRSLPC
jgi:hypothetical protein